MRLLFLTAIAAGLVVGFEKPIEAAQPLWQKLVPRKQMEADPEAEYNLSKERGPWLILAATFSGPEAKAQAHELILELRKDFGMPAYHYGMTFQMDEKDLGRGVDQYGRRTRHRYQRGNEVREHAVLVGDFTSIDDPSAGKMLRRIKHLAPSSLATGSGESTAQSLSKVRNFHSFLRSKSGESDRKGPMRQAFLTRNPMLPKEYFVPQGIEPAIAKINRGLEFSLMKCPGKYSVRVATFKGRTSLKATEEELSNKKTRKAKKNNPLVVAAKNAHLLTVALREKGWEAYEFHDRYESYVAIGSFDQGEILEDGRVVLNSKNAHIIYNTFGASSPENAFSGSSPQSKELEERRKQQFMNMFQNNMGQVAKGFNPKQFVGIPMDIHPQPVRVPRKSISSVYARK